MLKKILGSLYCYKDIHPNFWAPIKELGTINGTIYNNYMDNVLIPFNATVIGKTQKLHTFTNATTHTVALL